VTGTPPREPHPAVIHPRELLHKQAPLTYRDILAPGAHFIVRWNTKLAFAVAAAYGAAVTIWLFTGYTLLGVVRPSWLTALLFWSNGVQLVFCAVMTFVGNVISRQQQAKNEADHAAQTHIATVVDVAADRLDTSTKGGITSVLDEVRAGREDVRAMVAALTALLRDPAKTAAASSALPPQPAAPASGRSGAT